MARFHATPEGDIPYTAEEEAERDAEEAQWIVQKDIDKANNVRQIRDDKLKETDWVVIKNLELNANIPGAWEVYRQALRDIPTQEGFPWTITWPVEPQ
jgi:hypothetical protein